MDREKEKGKGPDWTFLPRTGPRQNVIMLIRDWFENVKCTRHSTAGYHEPPSIGAPSISFPALSSVVLSFSRSVFLCSSPPLCEHRYLWNLLHRARAAFRFARSLVRSPACSRLDSFRFVSSRRGPGDQKRFNLRYRRWRAKPRFSSPDHGTERDSTLARRVPIYTRRTVFSQHRREKETQQL